MIFDQTQPNYQKTFTFSCQAASFCLQGRLSFSRSIIVSSTSVIIFSLFQKCFVQEIAFFQKFSGSLCSVDVLNLPVKTTIRGFNPLTGISGEQKTFLIIFCHFSCHSMQFANCLSNSKLLFIF